jgi:hypothetical protein
VEMPGNLVAFGKMVVVVPLRVYEHYVTLVTVYKT